MSDWSFWRVIFFVDRKELIIDFNLCNLFDGRDMVMLLVLKVMLRKIRFVVGFIVFFKVIGIFSFW